MKAKLRRSLKNLADRLGYKVTANTEAPLTVEQFIRHAFPKGTRVRFLQVGAHDAGSFNDPINMFRAEATWSGTLVEPNPAVFPRLAQNLRAHPRCKAVNVAIADRDGEMAFHVIKDASRTKQPFWADQVSSLDKEHIRAVLKSWGHAEHETEDLITSVRVPTLSFESLLAEHGRDGVDLLLIDAEGYDFKLVKSFPFDRHRPSLIIFEHSHLSETETSQLPEFLLSKGYYYYVVGEDVIAKRRD